MSSAICFNLDQSKILSSGNGFNQSEGGFSQILCEKAENAGNLNIFLYSQQFLPFCDKFNHINLFDYVIYKVIRERVNPLPHNTAV